MDKKTVDCIMGSLTIGLLVVSWGCSSQPEPTNSNDTDTTSTASSTAAASSSAPAPQSSSSSSAVATTQASAAPILDAAPARPCEVAVEKKGDPGNNCVELERVQPEGRPLNLCFKDNKPLRFKYDDKGRIVSGPDTTYTYAADGTATRTREKQKVKVRFNDKFLVIQDGNTKLQYDDKGRIVKEESNGKFLQYKYNPDDSYGTDHNYPDSDEFCVADRVEVKHDSQGRPQLDRYDNCGINETPRKLTYKYNAAGQIEHIDVDFSSDGTIDGGATLKYTCGN
ncbi:MAG: hypothetical protein U0271_45410 [Polyangiaceae bacterium]